jgi:hypothetical protein
VRAGMVPSASFPQESPSPTKLRTTEGPAPRHQREEQVENPGHIGSGITQQIMYLMKCLGDLGPLDLLRLPLAVHVCHNRQGLSGGSR